MGQAYRIIITFHILKTFLRSQNPQIWNLITWKY